MAWIPDDAEWYIAEIIEEISFEGETELTVHINWRLIHAHSPEEAYQKACTLGEQSNTSYLNTDGKLVTCCFKGLQNLHVIYETLEDGAEILYEQKTGLSTDEVTSLIRTKDHLNVFLD